MFFKKKKSVFSLILALVIFSTYILFNNNKECDNTTHSDYLNPYGQVVFNNLDVYSLENFQDIGNLIQPNSNKMNVIMMVPDGQNVSQQTLARWYQGYRLGTDEYMCGMVRTYAADSAITDSAAAATAYATGYKTNEGYEGILPSLSNMPGTIPVNDYNYELPYSTILEGARLAGKSTGIVVTSSICHATPAGFTSHVNSRTLYTKIAKQQIHAGMDVILGGGFGFMADWRDDGRNLIDDARKLGYSYVYDKNTLNASTSNKLLGIFAYEDMNYYFDQPESEPSLEEMTRKAIEVLNRNENGFFLLVEGSKIDYASHANDPVGVVSESISYDKAFRAAVEFAEKDGNTVVISCADHGNGGMTIGVGQSGYATTHINDYLNPLKNATNTGAGILQRLDSGRTNVREIVGKYYGITDLTNDEVNKIRSTNEVMATVGKMMSKRANIGWISGGHTGEDVPLSIYSPDGNHPRGVVDNTDICIYMQEVLGIKLAQTTERMFIPVHDAFATIGANIQYIPISISRAVLQIEKDGKILRLPVDTNIALYNDKVYKMDGITVVSGGKSYVCRDAVELFDRILNGKI